MYTILLVDDDQSQRDVISYLLTSYGFKLTILEAENGERAVTILRETPIDILITDVQMPFLNGIELTKKARALFPDIEVLFFSGHDDFTYIKSAMFLKAVNYILKPINPKEFYTSILDILNTLNTKNNVITSQAGSFHDRAPSTLQTVNTLEIQDNDLLMAIDHGIKFKDTEQLQTNVNFLLTKYATKNEVSHLYIRYLCTTLMNQFIQVLPHISSNDFHKITDRIYQFNHFSDLKTLIEDYLAQIITVFEAESQTTNHTIQLVEHYIHTHYSEDISLSVLADYVFLSPKYLSSIFIQYKGISIKKYIKSFRIEKAKELLLNTNMKVTDISLHVGYPSQSYFCKIFHEETSSSPNSYRLNRGK